MKSFDVLHVTASRECGECNRKIGCASKPVCAVMAENPLELSNNENIVAKDEIENIDTSQPIVSPDSKTFEAKPELPSQTEVEDVPDNNLDPLPPLDIPSKDILPTSPDSTIDSSSQKQSIFQKLFQKFPGFRTPKVHVGADGKSVQDSLSSATNDIPPPLPKNYPSSAEFLQRLDYLERRHHYSKQKVEYYLQVLTLTLYVSLSSFYSKRNKEP